MRAFVNATYRGTNEFLAGHYVEEDGQENGISTVYFQNQEYTLPTDMLIFKQVVNGHEYDAETPATVIDILEKFHVLRLFYHRPQRLRLFYGDAKTGLDWCEEYDTVGEIGMSTGEIKLPLLLPNRRSQYGGAILDRNIIRIIDAQSKRELYRHPNYHCRQWHTLDEPFIDPNGKKMVQVADETNSVDARFFTYSAAQHWIQFMRGERMSK